MALIEAALSAAASSSRPLSRSWAPLSPCRRYGTSARLLPRAPPRDIEDCAALESGVSLLQYFRSRRGPNVTDFVRLEWCEKQKEFSLKHGEPRRTEAMIKGSARHLQLEEEIVEKVPIQVRSIEDSWAVKILNFIVGTNQLLFEGVTRELPVFGVLQGVWFNGVIDEVLMPKTEHSHNIPTLVETKTRKKATLPAEAQKRNARFQLMFYKYLWDSLASNAFPREQFFQYYRLNPNVSLSDDVSKHIASLGFHGKTLEDVVECFGNACCALPPSNEQLLLRYELQSENSLLEECLFEYDGDWFQNQVKESMEFLSGGREAAYVSNGETWKCSYCVFASSCSRASSANLRAL